MTSDGRKVYACRDLAEFGRLLERAAEIRVRWDGEDGHTMTSLVLYDRFGSHGALASGASWEIGWTSDVSLCDDCGRTGAKTDYDRRGYGRFRESCEDCWIPSPE